VSRDYADDYDVLYVSCRETMLFRVDEVKDVPTYMLMQSNVRDEFEAVM